MKTFLLDTNVLLHDPNCFKVFGNNEVIIPISVLEELDDKKNRADEIGFNARVVIRLLDSLRNQGSLNTGVKYDKSLIRVELNHCNNIPNGLDSSKVDNRLISTAIGLKREGKDVIVVSKDINFRVKCDALGIIANDYTKDKLADNLNSVYSGVKKIFVDPLVIDTLYSLGKVEIEDLDAFPNQFIIIKSLCNESHSVIGRYIGNKTVKVLKIPKDLCGIIPRNAEQRMAVDLLLDPNISLVSLIGSAGTGKSLIAVSSALYQVMNNKTYDRILISRPIQPMGKDLGFLPGSIQEKLDPWMRPIYDAIEFILGADYQVTGINDFIQIEPLTYIRGRSIPRSLMILDEAQNLLNNEIKTIITRMGEKSKIILTGDLGQVDVPTLTFGNSGLTSVVEKFKEYSLAGHITLRKGERSTLANLAAEIL